MEPVLFELPLVSFDAKGDVLIALFDGAEVEPHVNRCVGLFLCQTDTARALEAAIGSALKPK